ncbi:MAG: ATP-binding cassette domain-containing protein [Bacteroidota bacterium]
MELERDFGNAFSPLIHLEGDNFSGRSAYLNELIKSKLDNDPSKSYGILAGEIPGNYITGLAPTVENEISLHLAGTQELYKPSLYRLLSELDFDKHHQKNPFDLSGGEQAMLVIICSLLSEPLHLVIDTCLEQLGREWRTPLLSELSNPTYLSTQISIADNRFSEYSIKAKTIKPISSRPLNGEKTPGLGNISCPTGIQITSEAKTLALKNITFSYTKKHPILSNISYDFEPGNIYHLGGINGAGKSTLSKILAGVLKASAGEIYVANSRYNAYRFPGKFVGYSFQNPDEQIFSDTVREEVLPAKMLKENKNVTMAKDLFTSFAMDKIAEFHPAELPFTIRKRISLVASLANERDWYILDEPTIGQDQRNVDEIIKIIKLLAYNGKGIILISHSEQFISSFEKLKKINLLNGKFIG